jgi:hypothetical protein
MAQPSEQQVAQAGMAGVIERLAGELSLAEEPAGFIAALEGPPKDKIDDEVEASRDE